MHAGSGQKDSCLGELGSFVVGGGATVDEQAVIEGVACIGVDGVDIWTGSEPAASVVTRRTPCPPSPRCEDSRDVLDRRLRARANDRTFHAAANTNDVLFNRE